MAGISTHVLDNFTGRPGVGMRIDFSSRANDGSWRFIKSMTTNADGRTDQPVLAADATLVGEYEWDPLESTCRHASLSIL